MNSFPAVRGHSADDENVIDVFHDVPPLEIVVFLIQLFSSLFCVKFTPAVSHGAHNFTRFSLSELVITETELKLIAAAAIIGDSSMPKNGYSTPAVIGAPAVL